MSERFMRRLSILVLVLLAAFDAPENLGNPMNPLTWTIGPIINGQNYSQPPCVYQKSDSAILVMKSAEDGL
jgi:hypothetical protein